MAAHSLLDHLKALSSGELHSDVVLVAKGEDLSSKELPSHLNILVRSPVFLRMFSGTFVESSSRRVEIPVKKAKHLELVRSYLYTDAMDFRNDVTGDVWTAGDVVEVMALCDKYELPAAFRLASGELMRQIEAAALVDAENIVEHLLAAVGQEQLAHEALGLVVAKLVFGSEVLRFLLWLRQLQRSSGMSIEAEQAGCLERVGDDRAALEKELAMYPGSAEAMDVIQCKMLVSLTFAAKVTGSLPTVCHGEGTGIGSLHCENPRCGWSRKVPVTVPTTTPVNTKAKPSLGFAIQRLTEDMKALFIAQAAQTSLMNKGVDPVASVQSSEPKHFP